MNAVLTQRKRPENRGGASVAGLPRREFIKRSAFGIAGMIVAQKAFAIGSGPKKPNLWVIMSDEHYPRISGMYGNKIVETPNMDSLAAKGITFDTHYCNSPLCSPSRLSITAGKYISRVGAWANSCELPSADIPSLPRVLNAAGYQSFLCGKQHYDYTRRYGFTEIGGNFNSNYKTGKCKRRKAGETSAPLMANRFNRFHPGPHNEVLDHDRAVTAGTLEFLSKRGADDKPFFLFTGYLAPHFPLVVPEDIYLKYKGRIEMPDIPPGFLDSLPLNYQLLRAGFKEINVPPQVTLTGRELYYGMVDWIDREIGRILTALRSKPELAENTIIIYTSDHGENMGEHGMWWKNCMYEQASRVPLIFHFPQRWSGGRRRAGASSHVDLVRTLIDLGGGKAPDDWNGDSMLPWLDDPKHAWKDYAVCEYYAHNIGSGYTMSRSGYWKYTYHARIDDEHPAQRQLFNLAADPDEFHNVADAPENAGRIADMHRRMLAEIGTTSFDAIEQRARKQIAEGYHRTDRRPPMKRGWAN
jgi:choline-sulfatase